MEKLLAESNFGALKAHSVITATVTEIREDKFVVVDINGKSEGFIPQGEFPDMAEVQVGMQLEVYLEKLENKDGTPTVSYDRALQIRKWESIEANCQEGSIVQGRVKSIVKGGLIVSVGVDAFMPSSQIDVNPPKNLEQFVGQTFDFKIIKINKEKKNLDIETLSWTLSQFLHGEQGALLATAQLVDSVGDLDSKLYASSQVVDEARHVDVYNRYLHQKIGFAYPVNPHLKTLLDMILPAQHRQQPGFSILSRELDKELPELADVRGESPKCCVEQCRSNSIRLFALTSVS